MTNQNQMTMPSAITPSAKAGATRSLANERTAGIRRRTAAAAMQCERKNSAVMVTKAMTERIARTILPS